MSPFNINVAPVSPMAAMGGMADLGSASGSAAGLNANASQHGASVSSAAGSAYLSGPQMPGANLHAPSGNLKIPPPGKAGANKKLILFFVLLGVLTLVLIIVVMILMKK